MKIAGGCALILWLIFVCFDAAVVLILLYAITRYLLTH